MHEMFVPKNFNDKHMEIIRNADSILEDYAAQGYSLTLRQLYYQFVARGLIDENSQRRYKLIGKVINDARMAGMLDWDHIEDRTRSLSDWPSWDDPEEIIDSAARSFNMDLWRDQAYRPEVWVEKEALAGIIEKAVSKWRIPYFSCRGYTSQSEQYRAGKRMARHYRDGQVPIVFHLGDHDPSGCDMTRDNLDRLRMFAGREVEVVRLALNMDQIQQYSPPPNPAKFTDSRCSEYVSKHGYSSWELDALAPNVIEDLIDNAIGGVINFPMFDAARDEVEKHRDVLTRISERYDDVADFVGGK